jgi:2-dehydro-3-deoxyphosphooctonate aldolase (KDO 8-P synthase)
MTEHRKVRVGNFHISNDLPMAVIAGPCQIESIEHSLFMAENLVRICKKLGINFIYKSSFDKANRSSVSSQRGVGIKQSLEVFDAIRSKFQCPIVTDVHTSEQCNIVADHVDILQIPAFLCRQTDLLEAAAKTGKVVKIKKGQFLAPWDMKNIMDKFDHFGNKNILFTERGVSFGYNTLVSDMRSIKIMSDLGVPVVFDATHSVQQPGGKGDTSGGQREFVETLARAAVSVGVAAVFLEVHQDPDNAPSDGPNMVYLDAFESLLSRLMKFDALVKSFAKESV